MSRYGMTLNFETNEVEWDGKSMKMHLPGHWEDRRMEDIRSTMDEGECAADSRDGGESMLE